MFQNTNIARIMCTKNINFTRAVEKTSATIIYNIRDRSALNSAIHLLNQGEVIALPTDTVYGLACNANNKLAVQRLYEIKQRDEQKPVAICVSDLKNLKIYGNAEHLNNEMLDALLPGAITIVLEKSIMLDNPHLNPGVSKIGIRIPKFEFIQNLCSKLNYPLALTSANKSNVKSSLNINEFENIWSHLGAVFDNGQLGLSEECRSASTVIDLSNQNEYIILRKGISLDKTVNIMNKFNFKQNYNNT